MKRSEIEKEAVEAYDELSTEKKRLLFMALIQSAPTEAVESLPAKAEVVS